MKKISLKFLKLVSFLGLIVISFYLGNYFLNDPLSQVNLIKNTVMIKGPMAGGTGVIIDSSQTISKVLTNRHVCEVVKSQGDVLNYLGESFTILNFKQSQVHDLCLITVVGNLERRVSLSDSPPRLLDDVIVAGHPHLLPTVISKGYLNGSMEGPVEGTVFKANVITALIQPGSSGSAVYNTSGEIIGLVFAGEGDVSYGIIVPWEYVVYFMRVEIRFLEEQVQTKAPVSLIEQILKLPPNTTPNKPKEKGHVHLF